MNKTEQEAREYANYNMFDLNSNLFSNNNDEAPNAIKCSIESYIAGSTARSNEAKDFLESIREHERESGNRICNDERTTDELFEIFKYKHKL